MVVVMVMIVSATAFFVVVVVMVMSVMLGFYHSEKFVQEVYAIFERKQDFFSVFFRDWRGNNHCGFVHFAKNGKRFLDFFLLNLVHFGKDNGICNFDLIVVKLTEVLAVHLNLASVGNSCDNIEFEIALNAFYRLYDIRKFTDSARLDNKSIGRVGFYDFLDAILEVSNERTTNTARIDFLDINARFTQKLTVDSNLAKLVFDKGYLFFAKNFAIEFFDKRSLACSQKSRNYVNFYHNKISFLASIT